MNDPIPTRERAHRAWRSADRIKRLSDGLVRIGPWGLGIDGVLAWVPGAGTLYSVGAGGLLLYEAAQAGASRATMARMTGWLLADSASSAVPVIGWAVDTFFRGHRMAAKALQRDVEQRHGRPDPESVRPEGFSSRLRNVTPGRTGP
jgi:hypothetical protein